MSLRGGKRRGTLVRPHEIATLLLVARNERQFTKNKLTKTGETNEFFKEEKF
ncbi:hypothetical protein RPO_02320 [Rickettsia rickettsii str. Arizona]|uniref:Uncharacterized protein n=1 Tax=Rickettsia rickettsii (strain Sheila Smith) TaxID=392021 RepID=A0A0H3AWZ3_RICRS|nr:hypothetical protein A1G_02340 [Rickettsia rickettsii str. 'Sheila Smith']AFB22409.1 hypothetical protein RPN_04590 [Rickettsia rickettsii str. Brazil]AFB23355.1 hypothetical protein RPL_02310 [Rickettsia rickettsii str. Colombia]AFB24708.1 hypothetical protein RPO_02320 [Rickettsia rickettsii str. Arizona]AFB27393.1 hypothetical protein RPJ_02300 [Rickettsia rickettsii str. Hino]AFB30050.1 hypothetical protein RPM_02300 [Rickettsia rickettsii str. Hauke]AJG33717.1 hypothetical protein RRR